MEYLPAIIFFGGIVIAICVAAKNDAKVYIPRIKKKRKKGPPMLLPFSSEAAVERRMRELWGDRQWIRVSFHHSNTNFPDEFLRAARYLAGAVKRTKVPVIVYFNQNTVGVKAGSGLPSIFSCSVAVAWPADSISNSAIPASVKACAPHSAAVSVNDNTSIDSVLNNIPYKAKVFKIWKVNFRRAPSV